MVNTQRRLTVLLLFAFWKTDVVASVTWSWYAAYRVLAPFTCWIYPAFVFNPPHTALHAGKSMRPSCFYNPRHAPPSSPSSIVVLLVIGLFTLHSKRITEREIYANPDPSVFQAIVCGLA